MQCIGDPSETLDALLRLFGTPKETTETTEAKTEWALSAANEKQARNRQKLLLRLEALPAGDEGLLCYVDWCNAQAEGRRPTEERVLRYINEFARPQQDRIHLHRIRLPETSEAHVGVAELLIDPVLRLQQRLSSSLDRPSQTITKPKSWSTTSTETASPPHSPQRKLQQLALDPALRSGTPYWSSPSTELTYPASSIYFSGSQGQNENAQEVPISDADQSMERELSSSMPTRGGTIHFLENSLSDSSVSSVLNTGDSSLSGSSSQRRRKKSVKGVSQRQKKGTTSEMAVEGIDIKDSDNRGHGSDDMNSGAHGKFRAEEFEWPQANTGNIPIVDTAPVHPLSPNVQTVAEILEEWRYGVDGGLAIQDLNRQYGTKWRHKLNKSIYDRRLTVVKEYVCLVQEEGMSDEKAIETLQTIQGTSSLNSFYKAIMQRRRERTEQAISAISEAVEGNLAKCASPTPNGIFNPQMADNTTNDVPTMGNVSTLDVTAAYSPEDGGVLESTPADTAQPVADSPRRRRSKKKVAAEPSTLEEDIASLHTENRMKASASTVAVPYITNPTDATTSESEAVVSKVPGGRKKSTGKNASAVVTSPSAVEIIRVDPSDMTATRSGTKRKREMSVVDTRPAVSPEAETVPESQSTGNKSRKRAKKTDVAAQPSTFLESDPVVNQKPSRRRTKKVDDASFPLATEESRPASSAGSEEVDEPRKTRNRTNQSKATPTSVVAPTAAASLTTVVDSSAVAVSTVGTPSSSSAASPAATDESTTGRRKGRRPRSTSPADLEWVPFPVRNLLSVRDVWTEWTEGWEGEPSMSSLVATHGRVWLEKRYKHQYVYFYARERCVKAILGAVDNGSVPSAEEAIVVLEDIRNNHSLLHMITHELFREKLESWGLPFARKRSKKGTQPEPESEALLDDAS